MNLPKKRASVHGSGMAYVEAGEGDPIVFLHGNPMSSFVWRGVMKHVIGLGRCIAPDLIGMGDSDKLDPAGPGSYRFVDHRRYLDALLDQLGVRENVTFVGQDWGAALSFDWANRNRARVKGIVHMEAFVMPWTEANFPMAGQHESFLALRSPRGEELILARNAFIEGTIPASTMRELTEEEMDEYRRPFRDPGESRRPMLSWPREIPYEGAPADVHAIVASYARWLPRSSVPKLFINSEPGSILTGAHRDFVRTWANQEEVTMRGMKYIQEDAPDEVGRAIADWYRRLP